MKDYLVLATSADMNVYNNKNKMLFVLVSVDTKDFKTCW